jgi:hypothetical protein
MSAQVLTAIRRQDHAWLRAHLYQPKYGTLRSVFTKAIHVLGPQGLWRPVEYAFHHTLRASDANAGAMEEALRVLIDATPCVWLYAFDASLCNDLDRLFGANPDRAMRILELWLAYHAHTPSARLFANREDRLRITRRVLLSTAHDAPACALVARLVSRDTSDLPPLLLLEDAIRGGHVHVLARVLVPRLTAPLPDVATHLSLAPHPDVARALVPLMHVPHVVYWVRRHRPEWIGLVCELTMRERCIHALLVRHGIPPELHRTLGAGGRVPPKKADE